ncbi:type 1 fimbrial protein [Providencia alcalifaciens]|uniref:fimbrial protein n=1 Tax=Providencia alcalifaciens TaxID=126385 RepID=UPI001CE10F73|nr:fimbrial protein [Providencia alcalifaciens]UBX50605.1 type 1 fimbrial protein [Providencia alcalifaciens]
MKNLILPLFLVNSLFISLDAFSASTVTLNFIGNIKAATCNISGGNNIDIDLKNMPADLFNLPQSGSDWKIFNINMNNCSSYVNELVLTFSGTSDTNNINNLYKNMGTAKNIAVQLESGDGASPLGNQKVLRVPLAGKNSLSIPLRTRAYSAIGNASAGTVSANITATITYL